MSYVSVLSIKYFVLEVDDKGETKIEPLVLICVLFQIRRDTLKDHIKEGVETHLDLACSKLKQVELECTKLKESELQLSDQLEQVELEFSDKLKQVELEFAKRKDSESELSDKLKQVELECAECKESELQLSDKLKQVSDQVNSTLFTWRIQNFDQSLQAAKEGSKEQLNSEPFYTSPHKYKVKMSLQPNGSGAEKNTHLSVFITIMKGEYDAILPWPFLPQVTFTLIDQQEDTSQRENVVRSFKADPRNKVYARPVSNKNLRRGFPAFMSHEQLQTRRYIVDNTIFLKAKIEDPKID